MPSLPRSILNSVRQEIPKFPLPLQTGDTEPVVDLQGLLLGVYERAGFDLAIDYRLEPVPPLKEEDRVWADALLREKGLRSASSGDKRGKQPVKTNDTEILHQCH